MANPDQPLGIDIRDPPPQEEAHRPLLSRVATTTAPLRKWVATVHAALGWSYYVATAAAGGITFLAIWKGNNTKSTGADYWLVIGAAAGIIVHWISATILFYRDPDRAWSGKLWGYADTGVGMFFVELIMWVYGYAVNLFSGRTEVGSYYMLLYFLYCVSTAQACNFPVVFGASSMWLSSTGGTVWMPGSKTKLRDQIVITAAVILGLGFRVLMSTLKKNRDKHLSLVAEFREAVNLGREKDAEAERKAAAEAEREAAVAEERQALLREIEELKTENQDLRAELSNRLQGAGQS